MKISTSEFVFSNLPFNYLLYMVNSEEEEVFLTHLFPKHPSSNAENIRKLGLLMFSGGRERVHWEQID